MSDSEDILSSGFGVSNSFNALDDDQMDASNSNDIQQLAILLQKATDTIESQKVLHLFIFFL